MSQNLKSNFDPLNYSRMDFTALRAHLLGISASEIEDRYYSPDSPQSKVGVDRFLKQMRTDLIERSVISHPRFYQAMSKVGFGGKYLDEALRQIADLTNEKIGKPKLDEPIAQWFRPKTAAILLSQSISTLAELVDMVNVRGYGWNKPIPRLGDKKAKVIVQWLKSQGFPLLDGVEDAPKVEKVGFFNEITPGAGGLAPLETITLPALYDGSDGENRALAKPFIDASNDLEAISAYLVMHRGNPKTHRSYTKELERFLLWSVKIKGKPLSSLLVNDCEDYKDFLVSPPPSFCGKVAPRFSKNWKPFSTSPLSPKSQKYAVLIIRASFDWLVKVRYLAGNPWVAVKMPATDQEEHPMQIEKALSAELWDRLIEALDVDCALPESTQMRAARVAILLMGDSGLRREEVARVQMLDLSSSKHAKVHELQVLGKRNKWRTVPVSQRTIDALKAHLVDRNTIWGKDENTTAPLLSPLRLPNTSRSADKHANDQDKRRMPYSGSGIYTLVNKAIATLLERKHYWTTDEQASLRAISAHDFRHTAATLALEGGVPTDVVQAVLGHASLGTTTIYTQSKKKRTMQEAAKFFSQRRLPSSD